MGAAKSENKLKRDLDLIDLFCISAGAMISSGLFILPSIAFKYAGPGLILSYIIASLLIIPAILSKAELATAMPKAGGTYFFIDRSMGPLMGTVGGFAAWFSLAFKSAFALLGIGIFAVVLVPMIGELYVKLIAVLFCVFFALVNIYGVKHTGKTQIVLVAGLLSLLVFYIVIGLLFVDVGHFDNFVPFGWGSVISTAGLIFVSFGGLTKICSVAEECKKPGRIIPLGMFLAWGFISLIYVLVIFVTVGVVAPGQLGETYMPISAGAQVFLGEVGLVVMGVAAILAFVSTANAGLLAASRDPMAMGKDHLLPQVFARVSRRGTPVFSIVFTTVFMVLVIVFLDVEGLVKTASTLKILLFLLVTVSLVVMRESNIRYYSPKFRSPLYPYVQVVGIGAYVLLIVQMGVVPLLFACGFVVFSVVWYWLYARDKIWREYTLLHVVERVTGLKKTGYLVDEELREILIDRDDVTERRFECLLRSCPIVDLQKFLLPDEFARLLAQQVNGRVHYNEAKLLRLLKKRDRDSNIVVHPGVAVFSHMIKGRNKFELVLVRSRKGLVSGGNHDPIHAFILILATSDQKSFYWHCLMWLVQLAEEPDFERRFIEAESLEDIRNVLILLWKTRKIMEKSYLIEKTE